ncbi:uncharacterized protein L201_005806 [Kwoniella dendrophila CBS 6074]|uniref:Uncharacterized protein n=1 Tax=Kwoniella dendrophila CBS 6074 TaxID=1295534 RepID=A0AAX4K0C5_9TREE
MKPSPTLIPRLLPIFKHTPTSTHLQAASSSSSRINHNLKVEENDNVNGNGNGWGTWWLSNTKHNDFKIRKGSIIHDQQHTHTQTSLKYHNGNQNPNHYNKQQIHHSSSNPNSSVPPPTIAWNDYLSMV